MSITNILGSDPNKQAMATVLVRYREGLNKGSGDEEEGVYVRGLSGLSG